MRATDITCQCARLAQVQTILGDRVGKDVFFYSITIDPDHDTPAVLKAYARKYHAGPGRTFLTGRLDDIDLLSKKLGLFTEPSSTNKDGHAPTLLIGNEATGQWVPGSALDDPRFTAMLIGDWMSNWKRTGPGNADVKSYADAKPLRTPGKGEYLFSRKCVVCHTIGQGDRIGADLSGVAQRRDREWLTRYIATPDKLLAAGDPIAKALFTKYREVRMPNLLLSEADAGAIIDYIAAASPRTTGSSGATRPERPPQPR